jgi:hypothetical protein
MRGNLKKRIATLEEQGFSQCKNKQGVCHNVVLPFTLKSILRQKKNYGNSNISFNMQKYNLQKIL